MHRLHLRKIRRQRLNAQPWKPLAENRRWARRASGNPKMFDAALSQFFRAKLSGPSFADRLFPVVKL